jgi:uncharacterized protein YdhG (YjbR/CyaY superfamily)
MQSKAATVDLYLEEVPSGNLSALRKLRQLCLEELMGYKESMRYGGPCYEKNGVAEVSFASQKHTINLYILKKKVLDKYRSELKGVSAGKGAIRFSKPDRIDFELVKKMLRDTYESCDNICG